MRYNITVSKFLQKTKRSKVYSLPVILVLIIIVGFLSKAVWNAYNESAQTKEQVVRARLEFEDTSVRANMLSQGLASLKTQEGVEKEIRKKFSVAKEGEQVVVIIDEESNDDDNVRVEKQGFFGSIFTWVKNLIQ